MPVENKKLILLLSLGAILIGALFSFWKFDVAVKIGDVIKVRQESLIFEKATSLLNASEPAEKIKAIPELESILKSPSSLGSEARAKILLAFAYFSDNNPVKAVELLKETAVNESYPKSWRAMSVLHLALAAEDYSKDFGESYIFSGQPFETFYKEKDSSLAVRRLHEWSDGLFPGIVPNYLIAHWYAERLIRDKISPYLTQNEKEAYQLMADFRLYKGDKLLAVEPTEKWDKGMLLIAYLTKAQTLEKLYLINPSNEVKKIEAEDYFKKALTIAQETFLPKKTGYNAPFYYAAFLSEVYGTSKQAEIKSLLDSFYDYQQEPKFFSFLKNVKNPEHDGHYHKREAILVAKFDPRFKDLLKKLGWTDKQLNVKITPLVGE